MTEDEKDIFLEEKSITTPTVQLQPISMQNINIWL